MALSPPRLKCQRYVGEILKFQIYTTPWWKELNPILSNTMDRPFLKQNQIAIILFQFIYYLKSILFNAQKSLTLPYRVSRKKKCPQIFDYSVTVLHRLFFDKIK